MYRDYQRIHTNTSTADTSDHLLHDATRVADEKETPHASSKVNTLAIGATSDENEQTKPQKNIEPYIVGHQLVDSELHLKESLACISDSVKVDTILALRIEGHNVSRTGKCSLVSVATREKVYLFDITKFRSILFDSGLRDLLEDENVKKLVFDCREDADALLHQFNVRLAGVLDLRLLEVIKRTHSLPKQEKEKKVHGQVGEVIRLKGTLECIKVHVKNKKFVKYMKEAVDIERDWVKRPVVKHDIEYAAANAMSLFHIFDSLCVNDEEMKRLVVASTLFVDMKRSLVDRMLDEFENNEHLPVDVIPEAGRVDFDVGDVPCVKCKRTFLKTEFSNNQLKRRKQLCRVCKRVQHDITTRKYLKEESERREQAKANAKDEPETEYVGIDWDAIYTDDDDYDDCTIQ